MFIKPEKVVIKRLDLEDPEEVKLIEKLQEESVIRSYEGTKET